MRVVAGIVAMLLLAGCGPQQSLREYVQSGVNDCQGFANSKDYIKYKGKTVWLNKNITFSLCDGFSGGKSYCTWSNEIAQLKSGSFTVSDVRCDRNGYINFLGTTDNGLAGWIYISSGSLDVFVFHYLIDHPRKEKSVGGPIKIGMTKQQVIDSELGLPDDTTSWETKNHVTDKWKYGVPDSVTLFFEDGVLRMIKK